MAMVDAGKMVEKRMLQEGRSINVIHENVEDVEGKERCGEK